VFALTEIWLDATVPDSEVAVDGYSIIRRDQNRHGGGVAIYVRNGIAFNPRLDLAEDKLECIWVELLLPKTKGILVSSCYRPPSDSNCMPKLEALFAKLDFQTEIYLVGDLNFCNFKSNSSIYQRYVGLLGEYNCTQMIKTATRVTNTVSSSLDHVVTNSVNMVVKHGVLYYGFSDHLIVYCTRQKAKVSGSFPPFKKIRCMKNYDSTVLKDELKGVNWN
jgi:exonuclease III